MLYHLKGSCTIYERRRGADILLNSLGFLIFHFLQQDTESCQAWTHLTMRAKCNLKTATNSTKHNKPGFVSGKKIGTCLNQPEASENQEVGPKDQKEAENKQVERMFSYVVRIYGSGSRPPS